MRVRYRAQIRREDADAELRQLTRGPSGAELGCAPQRLYPAKGLKSLTTPPASFPIILTELRDNSGLIHYIYIVVMM